MAREFLKLFSLDEFQHDPNQRIWKGEFTFICAADTQFGMLGALRFGKEEPTWEEEMRLARLAIKQVNRMKPRPKFFVICGDMLDALPFDRAPSFYKKSKLNDLKLRELQYRDFIKVFKELDPKIKLVVVPGNHDVGDIPTPETLEQYREKEFGPDYFDFWVGGVKFVVLNSQLFVDPTDVEEEAEKHWKYCETIKDRHAKHIVVFQHVPFFYVEPNEPGDYNNIPEERRFKGLDILVDAGVSNVFCGHAHKNCGGKYKNMNVIVTSALGASLGNDLSGYRIVKVNEKSITSEYVEVEASKGNKSSLCSCVHCSITYISCLKRYLFN